MTVINREELAELIATATYRADHRTILPSTVYGLAEALETVLATLPVEPEVEWEYMGGPGVTYLRTKAVPAGPWEVVPNE